MLKFDSNTIPAHGLGGPGGYPRGFNEGVTVKKFTEDLEKTYGNHDLLQQLNQPVDPPRLKENFFYYLENYKQRNQTIPFNVACKFEALIKERIEAKYGKSERQEQIGDLSERIYQLPADSKTLQDVLNHKNIQWIPGIRGSLSELITKAKTSPSTLELPNSLLDLVQKVIQAKMQLDQSSYSDISDEVFSKTSFDPREDVFKILSEAAIDEAFEKLCLDEDFNSSSLEEELFLTPTAEDLEKTEHLEKKLSEKFEALLRSSFTVIKNEYGLEIANIAYSFAEARNEFVSHASDVISLLRSYANMVKEAQTQLFEDYEADLAEYALAKTTIDYSKDLYTQYAETADQILSDQQSKIDDLKEWFLEDEDFSKAQREFVFYTPTLWPGYEDKGRFALFDPVKNDGPINNYDFYVTDAVWDKMMRMADSVQKIEDSNREKLESIRQKLGVDRNTMLAASLKVGFDRFKNSTAPTFQTVTTALKPKDLQEIERQMRIIGKV